MKIATSPSAALASGTGVVYSFMGIVPAVIVFFASRFIYKRFISAPSRPLSAGISHSSFQAPIITSLLRVMAPVLSRIIQQRLKQGFQSPVAAFLIAKRHIEQSRVVESKLGRVVMVQEPSVSNVLSMENEETRAEVQFYVRGVRREAMAHAVVLTRCEEDGDDDGEATARLFSMSLRMLDNNETVVLDVGDGNRSTGASGHYSEDFIDIDADVKSTRSSE